MARFHIDTDMGVDDGLALVVASRLPGVELLRVSTVFGNVPVEAATRNARLFRHLLGPAGAFEIISGAACAGDGFTRDATEVHGEDGLGAASLSLQPGSEAAGDRDLHGVAAGTWRDGPMTLIGIGPATNLPRLVACYGAANVEWVVVMAGAFFDWGNITPEAEFNAFCDPAALRAVLDLGARVTIVPLDVCRKVQLAPETVRSYLDLEPSPLMRLVVASHRPYMDHYRRWEGIEGCFPHDSLAVLAAARPDKFFPLRGRVEVNEGEARGRTRLVPDDSAPVEIVTGGDLKWVRECLRTLRFD